MPVKPGDKRPAAGTSPLVAIVALAAGMGVFLGSCERSPVTPRSAEEDRGEPTGVYASRGRVVTIPVEGNRDSELRIRHEAIPEFMDDSGAMVGMPSMEMPFPLAKGVGVDSIAVGDVVQFTFAAWMKPGRHDWELRSIRKLGSETRLNFGAGDAKPSGAP
jgi:hypothetical protein